MSQRLIKPGLTAAGPSGRVHPRTGQPLEPIGYINGRPLWPVMGGAPDPDDPNDPDFIGGGDDDDESDEDEDDDTEDDEDEDDTKTKGKKKPVKKATKSKKDADDEEDDEDDEDKPVYTQYEFDRIKTRMRKADQRASGMEEENRRLKAEIQRLKAGDKSKDDKTKSTVTDEPDDHETREREAKRQRELAQTRLENAFLRSTVDIDWQDPEDALAVGERLGLFEDVLDEDGTVDRRAMARALRELAKRKPHLVKPKVRDQDDEDDDDEEPAARRTAHKMNGKRKGSTATTNRKLLEEKYPALRRR
jgi:hypothetical protein